MTESATPEPTASTTPEIRHNKPVTSSTDLVTAAETYSLTAHAADHFRTEEDLLGTMEVPEHAYYGIHALRAVDNFQISRTTLNYLPEFIRGMVQVKKAAAIANQRLHTLPNDKAEAIVWACDQILEHHRCMDQFPIDVYQGGAGTSTNMNVNEVVANLALEYLGEEKGRYDVINPNDDVNMSQSTNDAYPTGFRLGIHTAFQELIRHLSALERAFESKGRSSATSSPWGAPSCRMPFRSVSVTSSPPSPETSTRSRRSSRGLRHSCWRSTWAVRRSAPG